MSLPLFCAALMFAVWLGFDPYDFDGIHPQIDGTSMLTRGVELAGSPWMRSRSYPPSLSTGSPVGRRRIWRAWQCCGSLSERFSQASATDAMAEVSTVAGFGSSELIGRVRALNMTPAMPWTSPAPPGRFATTVSTPSSVSW